MYGYDDIVAANERINDRAKMATELGARGMDGTLLAPLGVDEKSVGKYAIEHYRYRPVSTEGAFAAGFFVAVEMLMNGGDNAGL